MKYRIYDIQWDAEEDTNLPIEFIVEEEESPHIEDVLSDYISDEYGYCHLGFKWEKLDG